MNLADNISYSLHDLEDALSLGMINEKQWEKRFEKNITCWTIKQIKLREAS
ncbi:hypothetical protein Psyaliredsea_24160 [Psychrobacter alimentarius]